MKIISESYEEAKCYVLNKRLITPVRYDTLEKFERKIDIGEVVDFIDYDSDHDENEDSNDNQEQDAVLNHSDHDQNAVSAVNDVSNADLNNMLPWVPRSTEYNEERIFSVRK